MVPNQVQSGGERHPADVARAEFGGVGKASPGGVGVGRHHVSDRSSEVRGSGGRIIAGKQSAGDEGRGGEDVARVEREFESGDAGRVNRADTDVSRDLGGAGGGDAGFRKNDVFARHSEVYGGL